MQPTVPLRSIDEPDVRWSLGGLARLGMHWGQPGQPTNLPWRGP